MVATPSTMLDLGTDAPPFDLPNTNSHTGAPWVTDHDHTQQPMLVMFICNHCPFVLLIMDRLTELATAWIEKGVAVVAISSNEVGHYPADAPDRMTEFALANQFEFPYLFDESQEVAKSYKAACTPDFFLFNQQHQLVYRGQFDGSRPGNGVEVTGDDLNKAVLALVSGQVITKDQKASVGCNIKWLPGNEPDYF